MTKLQDCMKLATDMDQADADRLLELLAGYEKIGVPAERAQVMAAYDLQAEVDGDIAEVVQALKEQHADLFPADESSAATGAEAPEELATAQATEDTAEGEGAETDAIDALIAEAEAAGVVLSQQDKNDIRGALTKADDLRRKAGGIMGRSSDPMRKGNAFPMGVGFTRMTKRAEQRIDASVRAAGEAVKKFTAADQAEKYANDLLAGKGTEADKADKAQRQVEMQRNLVRRLVDWKKGDKIGPVTIARVNKDADGYPATYTISGDGVIKGVMDKVDVVREFFGRDKAAFRAMVDEIRGAAPAEEAKAPADPLESAKAAFESLYAGSLSVEDYRAAYRNVRDNADAVRAGLGKMTKDDLMRMFGILREGKKAELVGMAYSSMLKQFSLGKSYGPNSYVMSAGGLAAHERAKLAALDALVEGQTAEDLATFAAEVAKDREARSARRAAAVQAIQNPKTLEDFRRFMEFHTRDGKTTKDVRLSMLTPEQRAEFDRLLSEESRGRRKASKEDQRTQVRVAGQMVDGQIIATKHTKKGTDLYVVRLAERVSREDYETLNDGAKRIGGYYSSYRGGGAVPGFQFTTRQQAEAFVELAGGDNTAAREAAQVRRDAFEDDRSQSAVERLNEMADRLDERADESLGRDRKANTERRARFAASAEAAANSDKALAQTMRNIAKAIGDGAVGMLDRVRQKVQVEYLRDVVRSANDDMIRARTGSYAEYERQRGAAPTQETADFATFPEFAAMRSDLASLGRQLVEVDGTKLMGQRLLKVADDLSDAFKAWAKEPGNFLRLSTFSTKDGQRPGLPTEADAERVIARSGYKGKAMPWQVKRGEWTIIMSPSEAMARGIWKGDGDKRITLASDFGAELVEKIGRANRRGARVSVPWAFEAAYDRRKMLARMGIETPAEFRTALREFIALQQRPEAPSRVKELERAMIGRRNDGLDFFPTPEATADEMVAVADIQPGMRVLEPSGGMGHIADRIRAAGAEPDVVEIETTKRELLEAKGYNLVGRDFLEVTPADAGPTRDMLVQAKQEARGSAADFMDGAIRSFDAGDIKGAMLLVGSAKAATAQEEFQRLAARIEASVGGQYDRIVMNPPFSEGRDIQHVRHAYELLKPGGRLVAIMGESAFTNQSRRATEFREWLEEIGGTDEKLAEGTFMDASLPVNTGANARMVVIQKPAGDERTAINDAIKGLVGELKTREDDAGNVAVFSRGDTVPLEQADAIGREFWRKIENGESFTDKEIQDALAINRRGSRRTVAGMEAPADSAGSGQAAISWQGNLAGLGSYSTRAGWDGENFNVYAIPDSIASDADLKDDVQARDRALVHISFKIADDGRYALSFNDPQPGSRAKKAADDAIVAVTAGTESNPYTRIDLSAGDVTSRQLTQEAIRRLALNIGAAPSVFYAARDTGARAGKEDSGRGYSAAAVKEKFSRLGSGYGVPMADAKALVAAIREAMPTAPPIVVHESVDQAPDALRKAIEDAGAYNDVEAAYHDGEIHVFPANIASVERMEFVVAHHEVRHHGLRTMLGRRMGPLMLRLYADNASLRAAADKKLSDGLADTRILAVEEALADLPVSELAALKSWDRIVAAIRQWLREVAAKLRRTMPGVADAIEPSRWTDRDIAALVQRAENISRGGTAVYPTRGTVFSRDDATTAETAAGRMAEALRGLGDTKLPGDYIAADFVSSHGKLSWWDKTVGSMHNLAQRKPLFKPVYDRAQQFLNAVSAFATEAADLAPNLLPKLEGLRDLAKTPLSPEDTKAIAAPIFEGTLMWTRDEDGKVVREEDPGKAGLVWTDAELRSRFDLNDKQIGLYREFRKATNKSLTDLTVTDMIRFGGADVEAVADEALAAGDVRRAADVLVRHLHDMADSESDRAGVLLDTASRIVDKADRSLLLMSRGYAPLMRFGHYTLDVVDADGERVYFGLFESQAEANRFARKMREAYPDATIERGTRSEEAYKMFAGVSPETLELFGEMLGLESQGDDAASQAFQEYLKLSKSNRSAMKRLIERKGVAGFSEDAGRVLAGFVYSNARQSAKNLHMRHLGRAVQQIAKEKGRGELLDSAVRLQQYVSNPVEEAQKIRGLMFTQFLGGSIAAGMVNLSQVPMVTFPYLTQFGGAAKAAAELKRGLSDALRWDTAKTDAQRTTGDAELDAAMRKAEEDGTVSPQEIHNLIAQASGSGALRAGDGTTAGNLAANGSNFRSKLMLVWGRPFAIAEQFNRRATFIAAYRMAQANGMEDPAGFAAQAVTETQFNYTKANRPEWARGAIGSVLFTFKTYSISYVELLTRLAKSGPEGRKAALIGLGVMFLMSGLQGIPGADDLDDLIDGLLQRLGYNFSSKMAKREFFAKYMGEMGASFMMRGVSGIPGVPIDVAGRLGLGNLIPGTGLLTKKTDHTQDVAELLGPAGSFAKQVFTGADQATQGNFGEAVRAVLPVAAQNAWKGYDMAATGMYRDMRDRKVIDTDAYDAMVKAIGFQPTGVAKVQDSTRQVQQFIALNKMRETEIADQWAKAIFDGDEDGKAEARAALEQWNRDNPESPIRITTAQLLKRLRAMREDKVSRIERTAPKEIRNEVKRELSAAL